MNSIHSQNFPICLYFPAKQLRNSFLAAIEIDFPSEFLINLNSKFTHKGSLNLFNRKKGICYLKHFHFCHIAVILLI
jgi:hypothetical protein